MAQKLRHLNARSILFVQYGSSFFTRKICLYCRICQCTHKPFFKPAQLSGPPVVGEHPIFSCVYISHSFVVCLDIALCRSRRRTPLSCQTYWHILEYKKQNEVKKMKKKKVAHSNFYLVEPICGDFYFTDVTLVQEYTVEYFRFWT